MKALDTPYLQIGVLAMMKKRAGWLSVLFIGESAVVLAVFVPVIIASGGDSGSRAATLIIPAMALGEVSRASGGRSSAVSSSPKLH